MEASKCKKYAAFDASTSELVVALSDIDETRSTGERYEIENHTYIS